MTQTLQLRKISCRSCENPRWMDGLKCPHCGAYQNKNCGKPAIEALSEYGLDRPAQFWQDRGKS